jgi:hypothetical protein
LSSFISRAPQSSARSAGSNRRFEFKKRSELFIRAHNEPPSVIAVRVNNPDRSPLTINGRYAAPAPTGVAEVVSDYFPVLQRVGADWPYTFNLRVPSESMAKEIDFGSTHHRPRGSRVCQINLFRYVRPIAFFVSQ